MVSGSFVWQFVPATTQEVRQWSYGLVTSESELLDPRIFGPHNDLRCECGQYHGVEYVDRICTNCGVLVAEDASGMRMRRLGHLDLAVPCRHPLAVGSSLEAFPIAPLGLRSDASGKANELNEKYRILIETNRSVQARLPQVNTDEYYEVVKRERVAGELQSALEAIVGSEFRISDSIDEVSLLHIMFRAISGIRPEISAIFRSCALCIRISGRIA